MRTDYFTVDQRNAVQRLCQALGTDAYVELRRSREDCETLNITRIAIHNEGCLYIFLFRWAQSRLYIVEGTGATSMVADPPIYDYASVSQLQAWFSTNHRYRGLSAPR